MSKTIVLLICLLPTVMTSSRAQVGQKVANPTTKEDNGASAQTAPKQLHEVAPQSPRKASAHSVAPSVFIIPVPALDNTFGKSNSRFIVDMKDGQLVASGTQMVVPKIADLTSAQMELQPNHWGLGGEHAFRIDFAKWGNGKFSADITTDRDFPITFKVTDAGYAYLCGRGSIKVKDGNEYRLGYDISDESWLAGIQSPNQLVREASSEAAGRLGLKASVPSLIEALKDPAWEVRRNASESLGLLVDAGDAIAIKSLEAAMEDKEKAVSEAARLALQQIREGKSKNIGFMFRTAP